MNEFSLLAHHNVLFQFAVPYDMTRVRQTMTEDDLNQSDDEDEDPDFQPSRGHHPSQVRSWQKKTIINFAGCLLPGPLASRQDCQGRAKEEEGEGERVS